MTMKEVYRDGVSRNLIHESYREWRLHVIDRINGIFDKRYTENVCNDKLLRYFRDDIDKKMNLDKVEYGVEVLG